MLLLPQQALPHKARKCTIVVPTVVPIVVPAVVSIEVPVEGVPFAQYGAACRR